MQKKGVNELMGSILVVLIAIIVVSILGVTLIPLAKEKLGSKNICSEQFLNLSLSKGTLSCTTGTVTSFSVSRQDKAITSFLVVMKHGSGEDRFLISEGTRAFKLRLADGKFNEELQLPAVGDQENYVYAGIAEVIELYAMSANGTVCGLVDSIEFNQCNSSVSSILESVPIPAASLFNDSLPVIGGPQSFSIDLFSPSPGQVFTDNNSISLSLDIDGSNQPTCWYSVDGGNNVSIPNCASATFGVKNTTNHFIIVFAKNQSGSMVSASANFIFNPAAPLLPAGPEMETEVTNNGVTFIFDKPYATGQFVNGDYWVMPAEGEGTVTIVQMTPDFANGRNGWEIDPKRPSSGQWPQSFDSRVAQDSIHGPYIAPSVTPSSQAPLTISVGQLPVSVIKAVSLNPSSSCPKELLNDFNACISTVSVLTVVPSIPPTDAFRPPYLGGSTTSKLPYRRLSEIDIGSIPTVNSVSDTPTIQSQIDRLSSGPHLDHYSMYSSGIIPYAYPRYGAAISDWNTGMAMRILVNPAQPAGETEEKREELIIKFTQYTIDEWAIISEQLSKNYGWLAAGGHGHGRLLPALWYASVFDDSSVKEDLSSVPTHFFGEISANQFKTSSGVYLHGEEVTSGTCNTGILEEGYWFAFTGLNATYGCSMMKDPYLQIDGGKAPGENMANFPYQSCCSSQQWVGTSTVMNVFDTLQTSITDSDIDHFYSYTERWYDFGRYTQPDSCAPVMGVCVGGFNDGNTCTFANNVGYDTTFYNKNCSTGPGQPGKCLTGVCQGGQHAGALCGFRNGPTSCDSYGQCCGGGAWCAPNLDYYGVTYGPLAGNEEPKQCIPDTDPSDGIGRFPQIHNTGANAGWNNADPFQKFLDNMETTYGVVDSPDWP